MFRITRKTNRFNNCCCIFNASFAHDSCLESGSIRTILKSKVLVVNKSYLEFKFNSCDLVVFISQLAQIPIKFYPLSLIQTWMNVPQRATAVQMQYVQVPHLHTLVFANQAMKEMGLHALQRKPVNISFSLFIYILSVDASQRILLFAW